MELFKDLTADTENMAENKDKLCKGLHWACLAREWA